MNTQLQNYAHVLIRNGLNVQKGQILFITAPVEEFSFVRLVVRAAYEAGASYVYADYTDSQSDADRINYSIEEQYFRYIPHLQSDARISLLKEGCSFLELRHGMTPPLPPGNKGEAVSASRASEMERYRAARAHCRNIRTCKALLPSPYWAHQVFPELAPDQALESLWDKILSAALCDEAEPVGLWHEKVMEIQRHVRFLNQTQLSGLHYYDGRTDLKMKLADHHQWVGGCEFTSDSIPYMPNFPTEEIFCAPMAHTLSGVMAASKPLIYEGNVISDIRLKFVQGSVAEASAESGQAELRKILSKDAGSSSVGEIAILPGSTVVSRTGTVFKSTLLDENAGCHLALGRAYVCSLQEKIPLEAAAYADHGINYSQIHVDIVFGTPEIQIDGILQDGTSVSLLKNGKWVI